MAWTRRTVALAGVLALGAGAVIAGAAPASADEIWYQGYQRVSADEMCMNPYPGETPWQDTFEGQYEWAPSWAKWANNGQGGWVCERWILWAHSE